MDIDRLSPFRALHIAGVDEVKRPMRIITPELLQEVKRRLLTRKLPYRLVALVQLNTGMRVSEPIFARREDLILKHEIPHIWVRKNALTDRKTKCSIRAIPLVGVSLDAARALDKIAELEKSEWLVPRYAHENGNSSCSAVINKHYGTNFFEFMNKYRVEEAKRLLLDKNCAEMTVLDILLQAGFNSKSAFHRFFNRLVGVSPTEFRKQALQKAA